MMRSRYLLIMLSLTGFFLVSATLVNGLVDPYRYYHPAWFEIGYSENQRWQNPGLAKNLDYENILIGTSHTEPVTSSQLSDALGSRSLNLSMSGSMAREQSMLLHHVLRQGKVRRVLWEINFPSFALGADFMLEPAAFPEFLVQPGAETPFRYLLSWDTFSESIKALSGARAQSLDDLHRWDLESTFGEDRVLASWDFLTQRWNAELRSNWQRYVIPAEGVTGAFRTSAEPLFRSRPDVVFDLILLPSTLLEFGNDLQMHADRLDKRLALRNEAARLASELSNVRIWDFQSVPWMMQDWQYYKDIDHFSQVIVEPLTHTLSNPADASDPDDVIGQTEILRSKVIGFMVDFCNRSPERCQPYLRDNLERRKTSRGNMTNG